MKAIFNADALVRCYAPPNLRSVMPGNKVMLRSGGPAMTVCDVDVQGNAVCVWLVGSKMEKESFALECLTCYLAA